MERAQVLVVGAGVVGLAIAERLSRRTADIIVVERQDSFGRETSSRNSEVVHAGLYYERGSIKAAVCVEGSGLLREMCRARGIALLPTAKIVPGIDEAECAEVHRLLALGRDNGVQGLRLLSHGELRKMEPALTCREALFSPQTSILDSHALMSRLEADASARGATFAYGCTLESLERNGAWTASIRERDGALTGVSADWVVNAAGLQADRVAAAAGIDVDAAGYRQLFSKGEYFSLAPRHAPTVSHLIYPAKTRRTLGSACHGVHLVKGLDGRIKFGPNELYVTELDYAVDPAHQAAFHGEMSRFLQWLPAEDLAPDMAGIRPMLETEGGPFRDFVIAEESGRGLAGLINLVGFESPGLTSCLAVARRVDALVDLA